MGKRRLARELVLKAMYASDIRAEGRREALDDFLTGEKLPADTVDYARRLHNGIIEHDKELDRVLSELCEHWSLDRLALVDKNIIKLGLCEVLFFADIPPRASINEAVELAKRYGSEKTPAFVNGILDRAAHLASEGV